MQSETTFARFSKKHGGLSPVPTGRPHVWESRGPRFISGCKSLAFHVPREVPSSRSRFLQSSAQLSNRSTLASHPSPDGSSPASPAERNVCSMMLIENELRLRLLVGGTIVALF